MNPRLSAALPTLSGVVKLWPIIAAFAAITASFAVTKYRVDALAEQSLGHASREVVEIKFDAILLRLESIDRRLERIEDAHSGLARTPSRQ